MTFSTYWVDEARVNELRELWTAGLTGGQCARAISAKFGGAVSRNMIIGKVHRLGLYREPRVIVAKPAKKVRILSRLATLGANGTPIVDEVPPTTATTLAEIRLSRQCVWPYGDPSTSEFRYCGAPRCKGFSYCAGHALRAYTPVPARKR